MNPSSTRSLGRCRICGAPLHRRPTGQLCPGCALENALQPEQPGPAEAAVGTAPSVFAHPFTPRMFGDYELLEEISRGGMGVVFKARQISLDRIVALKMLLFSPLAPAETVQRFRTEAAAAASLQHPNIVAIHEVGFREGQHFFAMDYVAGRSLAELLREGPLSPARAAGYVKSIALAIQYAHERGILHRDLKPSNILIDDHDQPRVTDFGLAKRLQKESELTLSGQVLGSPNYMPPEQAAANRGLVGPRSDVYALGAILYHLLTGRPPFLAPTIAETLAQVQAADPVSPTVLAPGLPRDLKTICLKCLEKEPDRRYPTALELANDLARFLNHEPIRARPIGHFGKSVRWCRRKPVVASLAAGVILFFLLGFAGTAWQARRASHARDLARGHLYAAQMKLAHTEIEDGKTGGALALLMDWIPKPGEPDFRGFDWRYLYGLCLNSPSEILTTNSAGFTSVDFSTNGLTLALGTGDGWVELLDLASRKIVKRWRAHSAGVDHLAFHPGNNSWLGTVSGSGRGVFKLWDLRTTNIIFSTRVSKGPKVGFSFSPGGKFLITQAPTNGLSLSLWQIYPGLSLERPEPVRVGFARNIRGTGPAVFSPDERSIVFCRGRWVLIDDIYAPRGRAFAAFSPANTHIDMLYALAISPDGSTLATAGADERIAVWDHQHRTNRWTRPADFIMGSSVAFSKDGQTLFASGWDQNIRSWNVNNPDESRVWAGHGDRVHQLVMTPNGHSFVSVSDDGTVRLWNARTPAPEFVRPQDCVLFSTANLPDGEGRNAIVYAIAVSPKQDRALVSLQEQLLVYNFAAGAVVPPGIRVLDTFLNPPGEFSRMAYSPDGRQVAVASTLGQVALLEAETLRPVRPVLRLHDGQITHIGYAMKGTILATGGGYGSGVKLTDVTTGKVLATFSGNEGNFPVQPLDISPDGKKLATASPEGRACVWDIASRQRLLTSPFKAGYMAELTFSPDGRYLVVPDIHKTIYLWDLRSPQQSRRLVSRGGAAVRLAFSPDGRTLASGGMDHAIRLWHPGIDQEVAILTGHTGWIWYLAFADNGNDLLSGSRDGTLRLWRAMPFQQITGR